MKKSSKTYTVTYHLAAGVTVMVNKVQENDVTAMSEALKDSDSVIHVFGKTTARVQYIPVRNLLAVNVEEELR